MWIPISLSILGLVLVYLEFFLPGGIVALLGGLALVSGVTYFSVLDLPIVYKVLYFALTALGCAIACQSAIWVLRSRKGNSLLLSSNQEGFVAHHLDESLLGEEGVVESDLKPSGHILVGEQRLQALSEGGYIKKGTPVTLLEGRGTHYIVKEKS